MRSTINEAGSNRLCISTIKKLSFSFAIASISLFSLASVLFAGTVTLGSDIKATTVTVDTADTFDLGGYGMDHGTGALTINGTLNAGTGNSTITVEGNMTIASAATFTNTGSTVTFDSGTADQTVTTNAKVFNNVIINNTNATATADDIVLVGALDVDGILTVTDGELQVNTTANVAGNLDIQSGGAVTKGSGAWTFDKNGTQTWTDSTAAGQDLGAVTVGGDAGTTVVQIAAGKTAVATSVTIATGDTLDMTTLNPVLKLIGTGTVLTETGTFSEGTSGTVKYAPASAVATTALTTTYYNLTLDDSAAGVTFSPSGATLTTSSALTVTNGILAMTTKTLTVSGNLSVASGGTLSFSSGAFTYKGTSFSVLGTFTRGTGTVTFDQTAAGGTVSLDVGGSDVIGSITFYNLTFDMSSVTTAGTLSIDDTDTVSIANTLTLKGNGTNRLTLTSDHGTNTVDFDLLAGGIQVMTTLTVTRIDSATGLNMIPANTLAGNCVGTVNWTCGVAAAFIWDGSISTVWSVAGNWDVGLKPTSDGNVTIPDTTNDPVADEAVSIAGLTINLNSSLTLSGQNLTATGTYSNEGTLILNGNETTVSLTNDTNSGLTKFVSGSSITFKNLNTYYNVEFDAASGTPTFTAPTAAFNVNGTMTITDGTVAIAGNALDVNGTLTIGATGALTTTTANINTAGAVSIASSGGFTKGSGTWTFDGTTATTYTDSNATPVNIGIVSINKTDTVAPGTNNKLTLASSMTVDTLTVDGTAGSADKIDLAAAGYTLTLANAGATATVLTTTGGTFTAGTSTVKYTATNSAGNITVPNVTYSTLELNGSETYVTGAGVTLTAANITLAAGTFQPAATNTLTISQNLTLNGTSTFDEANNPVITVGGDLTVASGVTWTRGTGQLNMTGLGTTPTLTDNRATKGDLKTLVIGDIF